MINIALPKECPRVLKQCRLTTFTICPGCGLIISNGDHKYLEHPMAQGIGYNSPKPQERRKSMSKIRKLRLANGHWRKKGNTPWKWFMDKAMILKMKYVAYKDEV